MSIKMCPPHKVPMIPKSHIGKSGEYHFDYQCPQCYNIICPEMSPKRTLRAANVYISRNWHGDKELEQLIRDEKIRF